MAAPMETPPGMGQPAGEQQAGTGLAVGTVRPRSVSSLVCALCSAAVAAVQGMETEEEPSGQGQISCFLFV